jgi:predicted ATPase/DNA-binding SARP family transcriptional activator
MIQPKLTILLLGGVRILQDETAVTSFASRKVEALLVYLACNPRPHPRETLAALLWPENDQNRALANLSVALTSLRKQLDTYISAERHTVGFNTEVDFGLDTAVFQQAITQAREEQKQRGKLSRTSANQLATAVSRYKGDFLAGFNIRHAPEFEAWALLEQERLRQMFLTSLADLITFHQQRGQFGEAIVCAQRLLAADPLQENIHRQLMSLYAQDNQRPAALAQYEQCARILDEELGVEPDEETVSLYEEIARGQEGRGAEAIPPLSPLHNLPASNTTFIGREAELARIEAWLGEANGRLLTITGPGGMGKTRLAQEAARTQVGQFADGVWTVSLVTYTAVNEVVTAVADTLGLTLSGKTEPVSQLLSHLQSREILLILDNIEHLLTPGLLNLIIQLTEQAPDLRLITTSRERLRLQAETVLDLLGLPFPEGGNRYSGIGYRFMDYRLPFTDYPAIQLFTNRAQRIQSSFKLAGQETAVIQLCQLVGGLPLALELAATWIRVLSVAEIVEEVQRGLGSLITTLHDVPERHRSLRAVIESSWQMLPPDEQALFRKLAVFRGGFTRAAAEQVAAARLPQLTSLVDRSFLRLDGDQRFRRHPLLLQFAQERLAAKPDEQAQTQSAHAHFFANFVQIHQRSLSGEGAPTALAALGADLDNIRAAWQGALSVMDEVILNKLVRGIGRFFEDRSHYLEGAEFFVESLKAMGRQPATAVREQLKAKMQVELGTFWHQNGRFAEAEAILQEANQLARQHNLIPTRIIALRYLGEVIGDQGQRDAAQPYFEEALQLCRSHEDAEQKLLLLWRRGILHMNNGDYTQAQADYAAAMTLAKELGNILHIARIHNGIGIIANRQQDFQAAIHHWQLARAGFQAWQHDWGLAATSHNLAMAYSGLKQHEAAMENIKVSISAHEKIGHKRGVAGSLAVMASIYLAQGKRREARRHFYDSMRLAQEVGAIWLAIVSLVDVAELEMSYGELQRAALLLLFVVQHPATVAATQVTAEKLLDELQAELPAEVIREAETAAASHTLDSIIAQLIGGDVYALTTG